MNVILNNDNAYLSISFRNNLVFKICSFMFLIILLLEMEILSRIKLLAEQMLNTC